MSPAINPTQLTIKGFPRVSGDEPQDRGQRDLLNVFSPRERG